MLEEQKSLKLKRLAKEKEQLFQEGEITKKNAQLALFEEIEKREQAIRKK